MATEFEKVMQRERFIQGAKLVGLDPKWLGKTYTDDGRTFKIFGLSPTGKRVLLEDVGTGSNGWSAPVDYVKVKMAKDPQAAEKAIQEKNEKEYRKEYKSWAKVLGLPTNGIGKKFRDKNRVCTILGLSYKRRPKVQVEFDGNRNWWYSVEYVIQLLKSNPVK